MLQILIVLTTFTAFPPLSFAKAYML